MIVKVFALVINYNIIRIRLNSLHYSSLSGFSFSLASFFLPAFFSEVSIRNSICPFTLRNSSAAHCSRALYTSSSIRNTNVFLLANSCVIDIKILCSIPVVHLFLRKVPPSGCLPWLLFFLHPGSLFLFCSVVPAPVLPYLQPLLLF